MIMLHVVMCHHTIPFTATATPSIDYGSHDDDGDGTRLLLLCTSDDQQEQQTWSGSGQTLYK